MAAIVAVTLAATPLWRRSAPTVGVKGVVQPVTALHPVLPGVEPAGTDAGVVELSLKYQAVGDE